MPTITWHDVARQAYEAYGQAVGFTNWQGKEMPPWEQLPDRIQNAWEVAVRKGYSVVVNNIMELEE